MPRRRLEMGLLVALALLLAAVVAGCGLAWRYLSAPYPMSPPGERGPNGKWH